MKHVVADWLNRHLSSKLSETEIAFALEKAGIEVDSISRPPEFDPRIVTATIKEVKPHPNADKLQLAMVETGGSVEQIVCGAPNIQAGQRVVLALPGAKLPDGTEISAAKIRGSDSQGMLCSEFELGLSRSHEGILVLGDEVAADVPLGEVYGADQALIEIDTAPNRWELQSYRGLSIEVSAQAGVEHLADAIVEIEVGGERIDNLFENKVKEEVPCYGLVKLRIKGDDMPESPDWMQRYLRLQGLRPINAVVDITNFVMFETGQPLHAFDSGKVSGPIEIRFAHDQEELITLDGIKRKLTSGDLVIADSAGPVALAGVVGGEVSEIGPDTQEVLLEGATFDSALVRKTAQRHGSRTDASSRFERSIPTPAVKQALRYAVWLLSEHAGAEVVGYQNELNAWPWVQHVGVRETRTKDFLGLEVDKNEIVESLQKLHFDAAVFDIAAEARKHLGKPYKFGAKFRTDGTQAFDCSYLVDYLYSLIGVKVGHTALGQYELGQSVDDKDLRPGDVVFIEGLIEKSATTHYYVSDSEGGKTKRELGEDRRVGHDGIYVGDGKVIMAAEYIYRDGDWVEREDQGVVEVDLEEFTDNPGFLGARRYVENLEDYVRVTVPWWRPDVKNEADIAEEVIKQLGMDRLPSTLPEWKPTQVKPDQYWHRISDIRRSLWGLGLNEVTTYPFISEKDIETFRLQDKALLKLQNPRSQEQSHLRCNLVPQIVHAIGDNSTRRQDLGFFEVAKAFLPQPDSDLPLERTLLAIAKCHEDSLLQVKNYVDQLARLSNLQLSIVATTDIAYLHPARQAKIEVEGELVGYYGEIHPEIMGTLKINRHITIAELDIDKLLDLWREVEFRPPSRYQSSFRDVTVLVPEEVTWQQLEEAVTALDGVNCDFKDEYYKPGGRAVTVHLELSGVDHTLSDSEIGQKLKELEKAIKRSTGGSVES